MMSTLEDCFKDVSKDVKAVVYHSYVMKEVGPQITVEVYGINGEKYVVTQTYEKH